MKKNLEVKLNQFGSDGTQGLSCPTCNHDYTHIERVEVFARSEDEDTITKIQVNAITGDTQVERQPGKDNPSPRRQAIRLWGNCEQGHQFSIDIIQHKGATLLVPLFQGDFERS